MTRTPICGAVAAEGGQDRQKGGNAQTRRTTLNVTRCGCASSRNGIGDPVEPAFTASMKDFATGRSGGRDGCGSKQREGKLRLERGDGG